MNTEDLLKLKQLEESATPGEWNARPTGMNQEHMRDINSILSSHNRTPYIAVNNADFIAAFRNHAKELIALAEEALASRETIGFYANERSWDRSAEYSNCDDYLKIIDDDQIQKINSEDFIGGKRARAHQAKFKGKE